MATTAKGTPYVESADLVSGWPAVSSSLAQHIDDKKLDTYPTQNAQTGTTYTFVLADAAKVVTASNGSSSTYTVPPQADVAWLTGTVLTLINLGAGVVTVAGGSGVTVNNASATLAQYESASIVRTASNTWNLIKGGGLPKASVSATTGSPGVDTTSRPGKTIYTFTGSGSITTTVGTCEVLVVGGGGGGGHGLTSGRGGGGGGAGGANYLASLYLPAGTHTVTVGGGGPGSSSPDNMYYGAPGAPSGLGTYAIAPGGGPGGWGGSLANFHNGGSGGGSGAGSGTSAGGSGISGLGYSGGQGYTFTSGSGGSGGGAGGAGNNGVVNGGNTTGGAGLSSSITGSSVTYAVGGAGGSYNGASTGTSGGANTGTGGGGGNASSREGGNGGSGIVIVVVG